MTLMIICIFFGIVVIEIRFRDRPCRQWRKNQTSNLFFIHVLCLSVSRALLSSHQLSLTLIERYRLGSILSLIFNSMIEIKNSSKGIIKFDVKRIGNTFNKTIHDGPWQTNLMIHMKPHTITEKYFIKTCRDTPIIKLSMMKRHVIYWFGIALHLVVFSSFSTVPVDMFFGTRSVLVRSSSVLFGSVSSICELRRLKISISYTFKEIYKTTFSSHKLNSSADGWQTKTFYFLSVSLSCALL